MSGPVTHPSRENIARCNNIQRLWKATVKNVLFAAVFFAAFFTIGPAPAASDVTSIPACACAERPLPARYRDASAVFTGTVTSVRPDETILGAIASGGTWNKRRPQADLPIVVTVAVDKIYKGEVLKDNSFVLHTSLTEYTCAGHPFVEGKGYLVFAYVQDQTREDHTSLYAFPSGAFEVGGLCGGTKEISKAGEDLTAMTVMATGGKTEQKDE